MKIKITSCLFMLMFFYCISFASILSFDNTERELVGNKSQQQTSDYLKLKMERKTIDEASTFIRNSLGITKDQKIYSDITNIVSALSQTKTQEKEVFSEDNEAFIEMKMEMEVEIDNVKFYIDKIKKNKNSKYKKEFEDLRKEKLNLENKLSSLSKSEYEKELFFYTKNQISKYKQKSIEYNKIASATKGISSDKGKDQKKQLSEKDNVVQRGIQEKKEIEEKLSMENDSIERVKLENKIRIKDIENEANLKMLSWTEINRNSKKQVLEEAKKTKKDSAELIYKLSGILVLNRDNLSKAYEEQIEKLSSIQFTQTKPVKDQWETTEDYNNRLRTYEKQQEEFIANSEKELMELKSQKDEVIFNDEIENIQSLVSILHPFINRLKDFQIGTRYENNSKNSTDKKIPATVVSLGDVNADEHFFIMNIDYDSKIYSVKFDFSDIGMEKAKLVYQNKSQFTIEPLFSLVESELSGDLEFRLSAFNVKHTDLYFDKYIEIKDVLVPFKEIVEFQNYENKLNNIFSKKEKLVFLNRTLNNTIKDFEENKQLNKFTDIVKELKKVKSLTDFEKIENLDKYEKFIEDIKVLDGLIVSVSASGYHTIGLRKDGKVVAVGNNQYNQCNIQKWENIIEVSAGVLHTIGLQKDGTAIAVGDDSEGKCNVLGWDKLTSVSAGEKASAGVTQDSIVTLIGGLSTQQALVTNLRNVLKIVLSGKNHIIALKKDGTVEGIGDNSFGQINVKNWTDIKSVSVGDNHTVGLKEDGTVVATGKNKESQCNVSEWTDIVKVAAGHGFTVGLKKDGTVICTEQFGKFDFFGWNDIADIFAGWNYVIGIKRDGTVISVGNNQYGQCDISNWSIKLHSFNELQ